MTEDTEKKKGRGRPRKEATRSNAECVKAFRKRRSKEGWRHDVYISYSAHHRLVSLTKAWGCTPSKAIERLILEAEQEYKDIMFPESPEENLWSDQNKEIDYSIFDDED